MKWLTVFFSVFIIAVIILANNGKLGPLHFVYDFPNGDKVGHFILFGILTFLLDRTFFQAFPRTGRKQAAIMIGLILALLIGLEEFSQKFIPGRTFSIVDLLASYAGVSFFSWLTLKVKPCFVDKGQ